MTWNDIALKHRTDKSTSFSKLQPCGHGYMDYYHAMLAGRKIQRVLEIGVDEGNSLRMWAEIFPHAEIVGLDVNASCFFQAPSIQVIIADATQFIPEGMFDLIVDDGSHCPKDILTSLNNLWSRLTPHGVYAIEDVYWEQVRELLEKFHPKVYPSQNSDQCLIFLEKQ